MSQLSPTQNPESGQAPGLATILHDSVSPGILVVDEQEQILYCTPEARRLLHLPPDQTAGGKLSALPVAIKTILREAATTQQPIASRPVALAAGEDAPVLRVAASPFPTREGKTHVLVIINDPAIAQRLEQNLNQLDRLASIGMLSSGMAHEIKNALVAVKTFVELLLEKNPDAELGEIVSRELKRIDALLSEMLSFRSPAPADPAIVSIHAVIDHSLRMLRHLFETKLITVHRRFNADFEAVKGNDYQLEQVFVNLFFNALEAMGPNGTLTVTTDNPEAAAPGPGPAARQLRIGIADNGIGISPENLPRLFEPFFTTKQNGTGLGMAITRRIIRDHHGDITAQSKPKCGTRFEILLPVQAAAE